MSVAVDLARSATLTRARCLASLTSYVRGDATVAADELRSKLLHTLLYSTLKSRMNAGPAKLGRPLLGDIIAEFRSASVSEVILKQVVNVFELARLE